MAEVPSFPNCVAWGDTAEETLAILESVVVETIQTYQERGYELPPGVSPLASEVELYSEPRVLEVSFDLPRVDAEVAQAGLCVRSSSAW